MQEKYSIVLDRIKRAAEKSERNLKEITIIAVTKTQPSKAIASAYKLGINSIGESRVIEAAKKFSEIKNIKFFKTHLIGHLQSNKTRKAIEVFDVIQTVDTLKLAKKINNIAEELNIKKKIMIQINTGNDPSKYGFSTKEAINSCQKLIEFKNITITGIMMIAPIIKDKKN